MNTKMKLLKRVGFLAVVIAAVVMVPAASSQGGPPYPDASGDSSSAGDITGVTVLSDKASGQIIVHITGSNLSTSERSLTGLFIDSDANPTTGNPEWNGADYVFLVDDQYFDFEHWNGSDWAPTPYATVRVNGGGSSVMISVNRSELGNTAEFNFAGWSLNEDTRATDDAPDDGMYNYSLEAGGPDIQGVMLQTTPSSGPRAGKAFVVTPIGLKLPPSGGIIPVLPHPDSYTCQTTIKGRAVRGTGSGGCTLRIAKKKTRGKKLNVVMTVTYEGATKSFPFTFVVS